MRAWSLGKMPGMAGVYRAALTQRPHPKPDTALPEGSVRIPALVSNPQRLAAYRRLCGLPDDGKLPPLWPQVMAGPLAGWLLARKDVPVPILGLVHVRNRVEQYRSIADGEAISLSCRLQGMRPARRGGEFDVVHEAWLEDELLWRGTLTALVRMPGVRRDDLPRAQGLGELPTQALERFEAKANLGRSYARVSGDYNPIHLHPLLARPFGFPKAIATGMWTAARAMAGQGLTGPGAEEGFALEFRFRKPVFLPAKVDLSVRRGAGLNSVWAVRRGEDLCIEGRVVAPLPA